MFWDFHKYSNRICAICLIPLWQENIAIIGFAAEMKMLVCRAQYTEFTDDVLPERRDIAKVLEDLVEVVEDQRAMSRKLDKLDDAVMDEAQKEFHLDQLAVEPNDAPNQDDQNDDDTMLSLVMPTLSTRKTSRIS